MIKILSIGNSFSEDATRYLTELATYNNTELLSQNLFIGGCPLETHYNNIINNAANYDLQLNGKALCKISIKEALEAEEWDFVTLQQVSHLSVDYSTYQPYLEEIANYVKKLCPTAKLIIHQTWAYQEGSDRLCKELGYKTQTDMFNDIEKSYNKAVVSINAAGIIPSGELFIKLLNSGIKTVHRDTFHATFGLGRYALALLWFKFFSKGNIESINFSHFDEPVTAEEIAIIKKCINEILK